MPRIDFPEWPDALAQAQLPEGCKHSFEVTIRWYLSFCQRGRAEVSFQSARDFMVWAVERKQPQDWQVEQWKEAIRWFFRAAKSWGEDTAPQEQPVWLPPQGQAGWPEWKVAFLTTLRRRKYSYRTEESYLVWIERFARHLGREDLRAQSQEQIAEFLDSLALNEQLSASSQRQALNALVFLYREVFGRELGDFSDYRRAKVRPHLPEWLSREEIQRLFDCLEEPTRLEISCRQNNRLLFNELGKMEPRFLLLATILGPVFGL